MMKILNLTTKRLPHLSPIIVDLPNETRRQYLNFIYDEDISCSIMYTQYRELCLEIISHDLTPEFDHILIESDQSEYLEFEVVMYNLLNDQGKKLLDWRYDDIIIWDTDEIFITIHRNDGVGNMHYSVRRDTPAPNEDSEDIHGEERYGWVQAQYDACEEDGEDEGFLDWLDANLAGEPGVGFIRTGDTNPVVELPVQEESDETLTLGGVDGLITPSVEVSGLMGDYPTYESIRPNGDSISGFQREVAGQPPSIPESLLNNPNIDRLSCPTMQPDAREDYYRRFMGVSYLGDYHHSNWYTSLLERYNFVVQPADPSGHEFVANLILNENAQAPVSTRYNSDMIEAAARNSPALRNALAALNYYESRHTPAHEIEYVKLTPYWKQEVLKCLDEAHQTYIEDMENIGTTVEQNPLTLQLGDGMDEHINSIYSLVCDELGD